MKYKIGDKFKSKYSFQQGFEIIKVLGHNAFCPYWVQFDNGKGQWLSELTLDKFNLVRLRTKSHPLTTIFADVA